MAKVFDATKAYKQFEDRLESLEKKFDKFIETQGKTAKALDKSTNATKKYNDVVRNLRNQQEDLNDNVESGAISWKKYGRQLSVVRSRLLIVAFAARMVQKTVGALLELNEQQVLAELKLSRVLLSTGYSAGITALRLREMASELSKTSLIADEVIIDGQAIMLTFTKIGRDVFPEAIKQSINLSLVFGQDLQQSIIQVGKALNEPITGVGRLGKIGVSFSEIQKGQIKGFMAINDLASAQGVILKELTKETGKLSGVMATTPLSGWKQAWMDIKDAGEGLGNVLSVILAPFERVAEATGKLALAIDFLDNIWTNRDSKKAIKERNEIIKSFNNSVRDQLRVFEDFVDKGKTGEVAKKLQTTIGVYKLGIMTGEEFIETMDNLIKSARKMAEEGGFEEPLTPAQLKANSIRLAKLTSFMERFRSRDLQAESDFQVTKAEALEASEAQLETIRQFYRDLRKEKDEEERQRSLSLLASTFSSAVSHFDAVANAEVAQKRQQALRNAEGIVDEEKRRQRIDGINKYYDELHRSRAKQLHGWKVASAITNTALSFTQTLADETIKPAWLKPIIAGLIMAQGVAQIATIRAQQFAKGGDFVTSGPQNIIVGDNPGGRERVQVTPLSSPNIDGPAGGASVVVNVSGNIMTQDFVEDELAEAIKEAARRGIDFGIS